MPPKSIQQNEKEKEYNQVQIKQTQTKPRAKLGALESILKRTKKVTKGNRKRAKWLSSNPEKLNREYQNEHEFLIQTLRDLHEEAVLSA